MNVLTLDRSSTRNPTLWVVFGVLAFTVVASMFLVWVALRGAEPELPASYHWEGAGLDADLARIEKARAAGVEVDVDWLTGSAITVRVRSTVPIERPTTLQLRLTHATLPERDRLLTLRLDAASGEYRTTLPPLEPGHWLGEIRAGEAWMLRREFDAPADVIHFRAAPR